MMHSQIRLNRHAHNFTLEVVAEAKFADKCVQVPEHNL
jgi:hypothetical protein